MGLGDVVRRLTTLEWQVRSGSLTPQNHAERNMLLEALNVIPVVVGFDCDGDGVPDANVGMFKEAAHTSCCRLRPATSDRVTMNIMPVAKFTPSTVVLPTDIPPEVPSTQEDAAKVVANAETAFFGEPIAVAPEPPPTAPEPAKKPLRGTAKPRKKSGFLGGLFGGKDEKE